MEEAVGVGRTKAFDAPTTERHTSALFRIFIVPVVYNYLEESGE